MFKYLKKKNNKNKNFKNKNFKFQKKNIYQIYKKPWRLKTSIYLYLNKKLKEAVILKKPSFSEIKYPFNLNLKLVNEYYKKK